MLWHGKSNSFSQFAGLVPWGVLSSDEWTPLNSVLNQFNIYIFLDDQKNVCMFLEHSILMLNLGAPAISPCHLAYPPFYSPACMAYRMNHYFIVISITDRHEVVWAAECFNATISSRPFECPNTRVQTRTKTGTKGVNFSISLAMQPAPFHTVAECSKPLHSSHWLERESN